MKGEFFLSNLLHQKSFYSSLVPSYGEFTGFLAFIQLFGTNFWLELVYEDHFRHYFSANGHITLNTPVLVRSLKFLHTYKVHPKCGKLGMPISEELNYNVCDYYFSIQTIRIIGNFHYRTVTIFCNIFVPVGLC